jgi:hypothetical protein
MKTVIVSPWLFDGSEWYAIVVMGEEEWLIVVRVTSLLKRLIKKIADVVIVCDDIDEFAEQYCEIYPCWHSLWIARQLELWDRRGGTA